MTAIDTLRTRIAPLREKLLLHPVYSRIRSLNDLNKFMQHHVFAVWDFMSLLKCLQQQLTCVQVPWLPVGSPVIRYLINEIVTGEECDVDREGRRISHFELYLEAMLQSGSDTRPIQHLLQQLRQGASIDKAITLTDMPPAAHAFVQQTFSVIHSGKSHVQAAVFAFGREDLIPGMFLAFVGELGSQQPEKISIFQYYLERHIEVDGGHHANLAYQMVEELCGLHEEKWEEAAQAAEASLRDRIALWDGIMASLQ